MRIRSKESPSDSVAFQQAYARELGMRVIPRWIREVLGAILWIAIFGVTYLITTNLGRSITITYTILLMQWAWQKGFTYLYRVRAARYSAALPDADLYIYELSEGYFISEHRGLRYLFPMSAFSHTFEDTKNVYFDFATLGRIRVPLAAFKSLDERREFVRVAVEMKKPNQSPEPTSTPVTPPAEQEPRQP